MSRQKHHADIAAAVKEINVHHGYDSPQTGRFSQNQEEEHGSYYTKKDSNEEQRDKTAPEWSECR